MTDVQPDSAPLTALQRDMCLARIGLDADWAACSVDLDSLTAIQLAFMQAVPFENLHVFGGRAVQTNVAWSYDKIVNQGRGGWCFEVNGLFAALIETLGFDVMRVGAAVLLSGPANLVDHVAIEVMLDEPYLVDVGFGDGAPVVPIPMSRPGIHHGLVANFELLASPQGTTLAEIVDGVPQARYRFKRVAHHMHEFDSASQRLVADTSLSWHQGPFATRLTDAAGTRVTLTRNGLTTHGSAPRSTTPITADTSFEALLAAHFGIDETAG